MSMEKYCQILKHIIMVDFISFMVKDASFIYNNEILNWKKTEDPGITGTNTLKYDFAEYRNFEFRYYMDADVLFVNGSIHKVKDNRYTHKDLINTLKEFERDLLFPLDRCIIKNIEFGVNIQPSDWNFSNGVLEFNFTQCNIKCHDNEDTYRVANYGNYSCKIYNLNTFSILPVQKMRWEVRFHEMEILNKNGIISLKDLISRNWILPIGYLLIELWDTHVTYEWSISPAQVTKLMHKIMLEDADHWTKIKKDQKINNKQIYDHLNDLHSIHDYHQTMEKILSKWIN